MKMQCVSFNPTPHQKLCDEIIHCLIFQYYNMLFSSFECAEGSVGTQRNGSHDITQSISEREKTW